MAVRSKKVVRPKARKCARKVTVPNKEKAAVLNTGEVLCPLCHGLGRESKEHMVVRWRSREFEEALQIIADECAFGSGGGLDELFEEKHPAYNTEPE